MHAVVTKAIAELGYRPNMLARGLRSQKTMSIGYVVSNISNPILADIVTGSEARLRASGYSLLLTNSEGDPALDASNIKLLLQRGIDGLILSQSREDDPTSMAVIRDLDVPYILVDRDPPPGVNAWTAGFDHFAGMASATRHLAELGHRDIALIIGGPRRPAKERRRGVEETMARFKGSKVKVFDGDFSIDHGIAATQRILHLSPSPTAIIAGGNLIMQGALRALHDANVLVGAEMSLVGCDDVGMGELHDPPLAIVRRDTRALGVASAELLLEALRDRSHPQHKLLPTEFVARGSCAPPRA
jgi:LacI family transcriptional regulator